MIWLFPLYWDALITMFLIPPFSLERDKFFGASPKLRDRRTFDYKGYRETVSIQSEYRSELSDGLFAWISCHTLNTQRVGSHATENGVVSNLSFSRIPCHNLDSWKAISERIFSETWTRLPLERSNQLSEFLLHR